MWIIKMNGLDKWCLWNKGTEVCFSVEEQLISPAISLLPICKSLLSLQQFYCFLHNYGVLPCSPTTPNNPLYTNTAQVITKMRGGWARQNGTQPSGVWLPLSGVGPESWRPIQWCSKTWHSCSFSSFFLFSVEPVEAALLLINMNQLRLPLQFLFSIFRSVSSIFLCSFKLSYPVLSLCLSSYTLSYFSLYC